MPRIPEHSLRHQFDRMNQQLPTTARDARRLSEPAVLLAFLDNVYIRNKQDGMAFALSWMISHVLLLPHAPAERLAWRPRSRPPVGRRRGTAGAQGGRDTSQG